MWIYLCDSNCKQNIMAKKISVYILDDDRFFGTYISRGLSQDLFDVRYFQMEEECLNALDAIPEVLILDHSLQHMTGLEILEEVRRRCGNRTHVIYLSAQEEVHIALRAIREGAVNYLEKNDGTLNELYATLIGLIHSTHHFSRTVDPQILRNNLSFA